MKMGKRKKSKKFKYYQTESNDSIRFDIEENFEELLNSHLDSMDIEKILKEKHIIENKPHKAQSKKLRRSQETIDIDLHGFTLKDACQYLDQIFVTTLARQPDVVVKFKIITGKGIHSEVYGGVLPKEIHNYLQKKYVDQIIEIEDSPHQSLIRGVPLKGHFCITLKSKAIRKD